MKRTSKKLFFKITIGISLFIIALIGIFASLLFWNSSYSVKEVKVSSNLTEKVFDAQINGKAIEINNNELNSILNMYFKKGENIKGVTLKGVETEFVNNNIKFNLPISYKGFNFLINSECYLSYKGNNTGIEIRPVYFKIGKVSIPTQFVLERIKNKLPSGVTTDGKSIFVNKNMILLEVNSLEIKENKLLIKLEKLKLPLEEKIKSLNPELKNKLAATINSSLISKVLANNNAINNAINNANTNKGNYTQDTNKQSSSKEGNSTSNSSASSSKNSSEVNAAINRVNSGLNAAMGSVNSGGQKSVISQMMGATNSGNPYAYSGSIKSAYNTLSPQEKAQLKVALFSNVNSADVNLISNMIGK